jgi:hypothetical protein
MTMERSSTRSTTQNLMAGILRLSLKAEVVVRLDQARRVTPTTTRRCPPCSVVSRASTPLDPLHEMLGD